MDSVQTADLVIADNPGCRITRHGSDKILKAGRRVRRDEAEALRLAHGLGLPVPKVYEVSEMAQGGGLAIVMQHVDGVTLESLWPGLSLEEKKSWARQLRSVISAIRKAPCTQTTIGGCGGGVARDLRRYTSYQGGPFEAEAGFNDFVLDLFKTTPSGIRAALGQSLQTNHRIVFTHADLKPHNIIVANGRIAGLVDWEFSGWYPEWWEYVKFFEAGSDCKDWREFADDIFDEQYPDSLAKYQAIARWQKP